MWARQHRLEGDLQRALALACHRHAHDTLEQCAVELVERPEEQKSRLARCERVQRLADQRGCGAGATDEPMDRAVREDDCLRAHLSRCRCAAPDNRREHERATVGAQRRRLVDRVGHRLSYRRSVRNASHTRAGVTGMSMLRTPRCASASMTALTYAAGDPTVADSPTPFAPMGWCGDGVTVSSSSNFGVSQAVGTR